jgi:hypothetical protein
MDLSALLETDQVKAISLAARLSEDSLAKKAYFPAFTWTWDRHMMSEIHYQLRVIAHEQKFHDAGKTYASMREKERPKSSYVPDYVQKLRDEIEKEEKSSDPDAIRPMSDEEAAGMLQIMTGGFSEPAPQEPEASTVAIEAPSVDDIFKPIHK